MSGTDTTKEMIAEGPAIILVEPQLGENIGMVARAMANFGLGELRLVNPRDGWPSDRARAASSGALHIIDAAKVFGTLEEAIADLRYVYATTARARDMLKPVEGPGEATAKLRAMFTDNIPCGVLFGRERWGLENEEVALADAIVTFPVNPGFASLNIAQAVLLMSYEWMKTREGDEAAFRAPHADTATKEEIVSLLDHLESALDDAGYFYPAQKREKKLLNLRNIFTHAGLKEQEIRTLRGVIAALERRWQRGRDPA